MNEEDDFVDLISFRDAIDAGQACRNLEQAEVSFRLVDRSVPSQGVDRFQDGPPVWLDILVDKADIKAAQETLRTTMSLFPEREVPGNAVIDDSPEIPVQVVWCETFAEAQEVQQFLLRSSVQSQIRELRDDDEFVAFSIEVMDSNLDKAFLVMDSWPG